MALKLFEFVEKFTKEMFLLKLTQLEKTGSIGKIFISLGNLIKKFAKLEVDHAFRDTYNLPFNCRSCLPCNNRNTLHLKKITSQKAKNQN